MGLVKFGQQTLAIDNVPDGHVIIAETEVAQWKQAQNAYLGLKAKIPIGVSESDLATLIEKGQRFDPVSQELTTVKTTLGQKDAEIAKFSGIPKEFTPEKWNSFVQQEQAQVRQAKIAEVAKKAVDFLKTEKKIDMPKVDMRFADQAKLTAFDPEKPDAHLEWLKIVDEAHTSQVNFMMENGGQRPSSSLGDAQSGAQRQTVIVPNYGMPNPADAVTDKGVQIAKL